MILNIKFYHSLLDWKVEKEIVNKYWIENDLELARFWYEDGNGSCDCNRALEAGWDLEGCGDDIFIEVTYNGEFVYSDLPREWEDLPNELGEK